MCQCVAPQPEERVNRKVLEAQCEKIQKQRERNQRRKAAGLKPRYLPGMPNQGRSTKSRTDVRGSADDTNEGGVRDTLRKLDKLGLVRRVSALTPNEFAFANVFASVARWPSTKPAEWWPKKVSEADMRTIIKPVRRGRTNLCVPSYLPTLTR